MNGAKYGLLQPGEHSNVEAVVPGQLRGVTLGWHVACVPRDVGDIRGWAWRGSHLFPCPSEMLAFIFRQLQRGWEPLGKLQPAVLEGKASKSTLKRADRAGLSPRLALIQTQGSQCWLCS